jgi:hypothetical protein
MSRILLIVIAILLATSSAFTQKARYVTVIAESANLRSTPSSSGEVLEVVLEGEKFRQIEVRGPWYLVETSSYVGWLHGNVISFDTKPTKASTQRTPLRSNLPKLPTSQAKPVPVYAPTPLPRVLLPPVDTYRPASGAVMASGSIITGRGYLTIVNGTDTDAIAKLIDSGIRKSYREVYIHANSTFIIQNIAVGNYELLFSLGMDYAPSLNKFLRNPSYSKFDSFIPFQENQERIGNTIRTNYDSYKLTLNTVVGGNASTSRISESEFEKY